jgi:hypothetical protein
MAEPARPAHRPSREVTRWGLAIPGVWVLCFLVVPAIWTKLTGVEGGGVAIGVTTLALAPFAGGAGLALASIVDWRKSGWPA